MNGKHTVVALVNQHPTLSQNKIAAILGMSPQTFNTRMTRKSDIKTDFFAEILDVLGYELIAMPKGSRLPAGSVRIDAERPTPEG